MTAHQGQYRELDPHDSVLAAVIRQAIKDYQLRQEALRARTVLPDAAGAAQ